jgi:hypothetical protein
MRMQTPVVVLIAGMLIAASGGTAAAQGRGRGRGQDTPPPASGDVAVTVVFRDTDRATFRDYFVTHKVAPQPLPPGIAKNVARGKPLPPGIAKKALPAGLLVLAPREPGVTYYIVGDRVVATRLGVVIDVLLDIFR